jgi:peptidoglycan/LPS O-acetylase OafA/YrhL
MVRCFAGFTLGVGVFRLKDSVRVRFAGSDLAGGALLLLTACLWLVRGLPDLVVYACLPTLLLCLALNRGRIAAVFGSRPMVLLGEWSYSIYLIHILFIRARERVYDVFATRLPSPLADALGAAVFFGATIAVSAAVFTWFEAPARDWLRARLQLRRRPIALEPSAP